MAQIQESGGGRPRTFEPNLVPFIDLMSVLITFLLITAVWSQVSMIQIGSSIYGKKSENQPSPPLPPDAQVVLKLEILSNGYRLVVGKDTLNIPFVNNDFDDAALVNALMKTKQEHPNKLDGAIAMADELPYERLIHGMDDFLRAGFPQLSILTGGPN